MIYLMKIIKNLIEKNRYFISYFSIMDINLKENTNNYKK